MCNKRATSVQQVCNSVNEPLNKSKTPDPKCLSLSQDSSACCLCSRRIHTSKTFTDRHSCCLPASLGMSGLSRKWFNSNRCCLLSAGQLKCIVTSRTISVAFTGHQWLSSCWMACQHCVTDDLKATTAITMLDMLIAAAAATAIEMWDGMHGAVQAGMLCSWRCWKVS